MVQLDVWTSTVEIDGYEGHNRAILTCKDPPRRGALRLELSAEDEGRPTLLRLVHGALEALRVRLVKGQTKVVRLSFWENTAAPCRRSLWWFARLLPTALPTRMDTSPDPIPLYYALAHLVGRDTTHDDGGHGAEHLLGLGLVHRPGVGLPPSALHGQPGWAEGESYTGQTY
jgi:hypothetical protein